MLSWEEYTNGSSKYTVSATNNITGETIIQKHGTTAPESVTSQDTKTQDTEDAIQAPPPQKPQDTAPQTPDESESDESDSEDDVF